MRVSGHPRAGPHAVGHLGGYRVILDIIWRQPLRVRQHEYCRHRARVVYRQTRVRLCYPGHTSSNPMARTAHHHHGVKPQRPPPLSLCRGLGPVCGGRAERITRPGHFRERSEHPRCTRSCSVDRWSIVFAAQAPPIA